MICFSRFYCLILYHRESSKGPHPNYTKCTWILKFIFFSCYPGILLYVCVGQIHKLNKTELKHQHLGNKISGWPILGQDISTIPCPGSQTINIASIKSNWETWGFLQISITTRIVQNCKASNTYCIFTCTPRKSFNQHADFARDSDCFKKG